MSVKVMSMVYAAHFHDITYTRKAKKRQTGEVYEKTIRVLNCNLKSVCVALADHANDEGEGSYPSVETLECKTELSNVTVVACLKAMKQEGIISYAGRSKWNTGNYTVNKAKLEEMAGWERQKRRDPKSEAASHSENEAASLLKMKPLHKESEAASHKPSIPPKPSSNEEEGEHLEVLTLKKLYEQNIGDPTPLLMQMFRNAAKTYPEEWFQPAFEVLVKSAKHRSWAFVEAVLQGWKDHGYGWKPEQKKPGRASSRPAPAQAPQHADLEAMRELARKELLNADA